MYECNPTLLELKSALLSEIKKGEGKVSSQQFEVTLPKKYSHKAIKKVLLSLGYEARTKKPELKFTIRKLKS